MNSLIRFIIWTPWQLVAVLLVGLTVLLTLGVAIWPTKSWIVRWSAAGIFYFTFMMPVGQVVAGFEPTMARKFVFTFGVFSVPIALLLGFVFRWSRLIDPPRPLTADDLESMGDEDVEEQLGGRP